MIQDLLELQEQQALRELLTLQEIRERKDRLARREQLDKRLLQVLKDRREFLGLWVQLVLKENKDVQVPLAQLGRRDRRAYRVTRDCWAIQVQLGELVQLEQQVLHGLLVRRELQVLPVH